MNRLVIEGELPALNEIIDAAKAHWSVYREMKETNTDLVAWQAKRLPKMERVNIIITWHCKNRRKDKDNIMGGQKFILDGLQKAGVLKNDGWMQVEDIIHRFRVDKNNPRVEVEFEKVG